MCLTPWVRCSGLVLVYIVCIAETVIKGYHLQVSIDLAPLSSLPFDYTVPSADHIPQHGDFDYVCPAPLVSVSKNELTVQGPQTAAMYARQDGEALG